MVRSLWDGGRLVNRLLKTTKSTISSPNYFMSVEQGDHIDKVLVNLGKPATNNYGLSALNQLRGIFQGNVGREIWFTKDV